MPYETLRQSYKPHEVKVLFVGESRPNQGTFFYCEDSNLFKYTKIVFEKVFGNKFNCDTFKSMGFWLYDVCDAPVNNLQPQDRILQIRQGVPALIQTISDLRPKYIIVVKRGTLRDSLSVPLSEIGFIENQNAFYLPFPACGQQTRYIYQLNTLLEKIKTVF